MPGKSRISSQWKWSKRYQSGNATMIAGTKIGESAQGPLRISVTCSQSRGVLHSVASLAVMMAPRRQAHDYIGYRSLLSKILKTLGGRKWYF